MSNKYDQDKRIVLTLDAGGTNFAFNAVQSNKELFTPHVVTAQYPSLKETLQAITAGFEFVKNQCADSPSAISFCFPGPTEYELGIIGDLENLPQFRGGVALGPMLEKHFKIPVFISNDGDMFAYGEAIAGFLPFINRRLEKNNSPKRFKNLLGVTLGTGFGGGIISEGKLFKGDNSAQGEINRIRNFLYPQFSAEESVTIRGVRRIFARESGILPEDTPDPKTIFDIGMRKVPGNYTASLKAYRELGQVAGDAISNASTLVDGLVVIGGGLSGAYPLYLSILVDTMNQGFRTPKGGHLERMEVKAYNLEDDEELERFIEGNTRKIQIPFSNSHIVYDPLKRIGVGISKLGTNTAVSVGTYAYALDQLDHKN